MTEQTAPWPEVPLGDVIDISSGDFIKRVDYAGTSSDRPYRVVGAGGPIGYTREFNAAPPSLVLGRVGAAGAVNEYDDPVWVSDNALIVRPTERIELRFLAQFLRTVPWRDIQTGSAQPLITQTLVNKICIPLPPIEEQRRIAAKLDDLLGRVAATRERLDHVPKILRRFRQSVLAAAVSGRLTEDVNEGVVDEWPNGWRDTTLGHLASLVTSGSRGWAKYYSADGPSFIRSQDINTDTLNLREAAHVTPPRASEGSRTRVELGDILVTITGANVTKTAVVNEPPGEAYVSQHVGLVRLREPDLSRFVHCCLLSEQHGRGQLKDAAYGAGKPGLNLDNLREVTLALPPPAELEEILRRTQAILSIGERAAARSYAAARDSERIREAVLARAFRGELA